MKLGEYFERKNHEELVKELTTDDLYQIICGKFIDYYVARELCDRADMADAFEDAYNEDIADGYICPITEKSLSAWKKNVERGISDSTDEELIATYTRYLAEFDTYEVSTIPETMYLAEMMMSEANGGSVEHVLDEALEKLGF